MNLSGGQARRASIWRFRRSWIAITILVVMDVIFIVPAVTTLIQASGEWSHFDSLFDLVIAIFLSAWLLGWSMAPLIMTTILVLMLFGRETLRVRPGMVELTIGLPLAGLTAIYDVSRMRNLRLVNPEKKTRTSWRGRHFAFDYGANTVSFGSGVLDGELDEIRNRIESGSGTPIRRGAALAGEADKPWEQESLSVTEGAAEPGPVDVAGPLKLTSASTLALIAANLVPVAGTLFLGWNLSDVLVLYWAESAVIGFFNVFKIILISRWGALFFVPFFLGHFGGFMAVHFLFIYTIFVKGMQGMNNSGGDLADVAALFFNLWPALAALFISHAYSFFSNFVGHAEYRRRSTKDQMGEPYSRIIFMQLVLILGGGLSMIIGQTTPVLLAVIGLKVYFDVKAHIKEHAPSN